MSVMDNEKKRIEDLQAEIDRLRSRVAELDRRCAGQGDAVCFGDDSLVRGIINASMEGVFLESLDGSIIDCNELAHNLYGYTREQMLALNVRDLLPGDQAENFNSLADETRQKGMIRVKAQGKKADGAIFPVEVSIHLVVLGTGEFSIVFVRDISPLKRASDRAEKSEEKYQRLVEDINEVIYTLDLEGNVTFLSPRVRVLLDYSPEELVGRHFSALVYPDDLPFIQKEFQELLDGNYRPSDYRLVKKNGEPVYVQTYSTLIRRDGAAVGITGVLTDIHALKMTEEKLRQQNVMYEALNRELTAANEELEAMYEELLATNEELETTNQELTGAHQTLIEANIEHEKSEQRYRALFENSPTPLVEFDGTALKQHLDALTAQGESDIVKRLAEDPGAKGAYLEMLKVLAVNKAALDLLGFDPDDRNVYPNEMFFPDQSFGSFISQMASLYSGKKLIDDEVEFRTLAGRPVTVMLRVSVPENHREDWSRVILSAIDITERRRLEEQVRQAQKMEAVGRLAGGVAHDFNNLLTVITGNTGILLNDEHCSESVRTMIEEIQIAGERGADLTRQLLAFGRKQVLRPSLLNLNDIIASIEKMLRRLIGENIVFTTEYDGSLHSVKADAGQMEQVLINLVVNARDAMPEGGSLAITTSNEDLAVDMIGDSGVIPAGRFAVLSVADTGSGIDDRIREHIFEPFFTTKEVGRGSGLGLATVYGIVRQSGGHIDVKSAPDSGSTFKVYFPAVEREKRSDLPGARPPLGLNGTETVLVVEDDPMVSDMIRRVMEHYGYAVLLAEHPDEAISLCSSHQGPIHALVSDVIMPGMDGFELAAKLRKTRPDLKVLFVSGYSEDSFPHSSGEIKGDGFLQKPFAPDDLLARLREMIDGGRRGTSSPR